ncbi:MAG: hypothetical protein GY765_02835 [bacterium]|nr:hypothetical protein [bacterium]
MKYKINEEFKFNHKKNGHDVSHQLRKLTVEDFNAMETKFPNIVSGKQNGELDGLRSSKAENIFLYDRVCTDVSGYPDKEAVSILDKAGVIAALRRVKVVSREDVEAKAPEILCDGFKECTYTAGVQGAALTFQAHIFSNPTEADLKEYERITGMKKTVKGDEVTLALNPVFVGLCAIYDRMITEVNGYEGEVELPVGVPVEHKKKAIEELFKSTQKEQGEFEVN